MSLTRANCPHGLRQGECLECKRLEGQCDFGVCCERADRVYTSPLGRRRKVCENHGRELVRSQGGTSRTLAGDHYDRVLEEAS